MSQSGNSLSSESFSIVRKENVHVQNEDTWENEEESPAHDETAVADHESVEYIWNSISKLTQTEIELTIAGDNVSTFVVLRKEDNNSNSMKE